MNTLIYLIPVALSLGGLGLVAFLWALKSGQYEDLDGASWRILDDGDRGDDSSQAGCLTKINLPKPTEG
ncbi:cbb3-type cytochrome oxidase assembly protein CcoS [Sinorhizobium medicae]|nr:cbb3-type cytochrome oxidase assembly protein CcoS [Sinorhizobium medicae]MDX1010021.1 cbb3-type cytochrome oxidase assembly protein CcoS [Sinorhizobium medicae]MDX1064953.1 cbb3-type cytochrome oxidase assembly protein CcoS [Sinorhizobium medicae]MDX1084404.1 cbb3-type cytochrome oxidase assembly protein CcoS [Sinorhizobium medicae]